MNSGKIIKEELSFRYFVSARDSSTVRNILENSGVFKPHEIEVALELTGEWITKGESSGYYFIFADYNDETVGYICYGPITMTEQRFDIYWLAVDRSMHGKGIGSSLIREAEKKIAESDGCLIFVETSSKDGYNQAREFYKKHGYQAVAWIPDYYAENDDKVILMKNIRPAQ